MATSIVQSLAWWRSSSTHHSQSADERRDKVMIEVNRPTFSRLSPSLKDACHFIAFSTLCQRLPELPPYVQYLKPDVLQELSEPCVVE